MAILEWLTRTTRSSRWRSFPSFQTLVSHFSQRLRPSLCHESALEVSTSRILREDRGLADNANEDLKGIAKKERQRIKELLRSRGISLYARYSVAVKNKKIRVKFQIPPSCEVLHLITTITEQLGLKAEGHGGCSDMILRAWHSTVDWRLTLTPPSKQKHIQENDPSSTDMNAHDSDLCVLIVHSPSDKEIEFIKRGNMSPEELDAFISVLRLADSDTVRCGPPLIYVPKEDTLHSVQKRKDKLFSQFDTLIGSALPDHHNRQKIASKYAKHLSKPELEELARVTELMSGRGIRDVCRQAERSWASKIIRGQVSKDGEQASLPPLQEYIQCARNWQLRF